MGSARHAPLQAYNIGRAIIARDMAQREVPQVKIYPTYNPLTSQLAKLQLTDLEFLRARLVGLQAISTDTAVVADHFELPYKFSGTTAAVAIGSALITGTGAAFFPARHGSKLDPVQALRSQ